MKHLKVFEDFSGDLYSEIGANEYDEIIWSSKIEDANLNKSDSDKLKSFIKSRGLNYKVMVSGNESRIKTIIYQGEFPGEYLYQQKKGEIENIISIIKCGDDWYVVDATKIDYLISGGQQSEETVEVEKYYKCDQLDGLLKCLGDIIPDMFF